MKMKTYKIKEFSERTSVSVRTLHHYDEISLLTPKMKSDAGYRLYSDDDLLRLQQICSLKFMGFSLKEVKSMLDQGCDLQASLQAQATILRDRAALLKRAVSCSEVLLKQIRYDEQIDWDNVIKLIEVMKMSNMNREEWKRTYFTDEERKQYDEIIESHSEEEREAIRGQWADIFGRIAKNLGQSPESDFGFEIASEAITLVKKLYRGNMEIAAKVWTAFETGTAPRDKVDYDPKVIEFLGKAFEAHTKKLGL